jgi:hypothetical protein
MSKILFSPFTFNLTVLAVRPPYGMYIENTRRLFVSHYDTQKGVGKKYNFLMAFKDVPISGKLLSMLIGSWCMTTTKRSSTVVIILTVFER